MLRGERYVTVEADWMAASTSQRMLAGPPAPPRPGRGQGEYPHEPVTMLTDP